MIGKIVPWMFELDHYHYSQWMTVHVKDLLLENISPTTYSDFVSGNLSPRSPGINSLAHDQVYE